MKKTFLIIGGILLLAGSAFAFFRMRAGGGAPAVLKVTSTPPANIFLDNQNIGKTPYEDKHASGEFTLKLVPETTSETLTSWEEKITLRANLLTYVNQELGSSDLTTQGEVLTLEKGSGSGAELAVISSPDGAAVTLSGENKGTTPQVVEDLPVGSYDLTLVKDGFTSRTVKIKATGGYKLTASFQLASTGTVLSSPQPSSSSGTPAASPKTTPSASAKASPKVSTIPGSSASPGAKATPPPKPYVEILDTPTGFLRVREEASSGAKELSRVNPGEYFALLDETDVSGTTWYKIEYEPEKEGFISGQYAKKFE